MTTDPIADMLTRIRNAIAVGHEKVTMPASKMKVGIARILVDEGFIDRFDVKANGSMSELELVLRYGNRRQPAIEGIKRIARGDRNTRDFTFTTLREGLPPDLLTLYVPYLFARTVGVRTGDKGRGRDGERRRRATTGELDLIDRLDVSILQDYILEPVLGIHDPTTDKRLEFVGGKRGTDELERLVDEGHACIAFSLYPTTMDDMLAISDIGGTMPPKSTWFEPKLKDGLLVHII